MDAKPPFIFPVRVYYEDTDAGGVVYHANYLKYLERARSEWLRNLGFSEEILRTQEKLAFVVHHVDILFQRPARLDDDLKVSVMVEAVRKTRVYFQQTIERDGECLIKAKVAVVALDIERFKAVKVPSYIWQGQQSS
jgi:acyl-CoA thioester hydrolase